MALDRSDGQASRESAVARVEALVQAVEAAPEDREILAELAAAADAWVAADGRISARQGEARRRAALAGWVAGLVERGVVLHLGCRHGEVGAALASDRRRVVSFLDHPGRALSAAARLGFEPLTFRTLAEYTPRRGTGVEMVVVETVGLLPVAEPERIRPALRDGGWLAVVGMPQRLDEPWLVEAGSFLADRDGRIVPAPAGSADTMVTLYRKVPSAEAGARSGTGPAADAWRRVERPPDLATERARLRAAAAELFADREPDDEMPAPQR